MNYKVIKSFTDKYTKTKYQVGDVLELTDERAKEILSVGKLIEKIEVETSENETEQVETPKKNKRKKGE